MRRWAPLLGLLALACASPPPPVTVSDGRYVMGTVLELTLVARDEASGRAALAELFARAEALDALLTVYDPASALSRLNAAAGGGPQPVEPELARVLELALRYARLTRGAFDVSVGPLVGLWTEAAVRGQRPSPQRLAAARGRVGPGLLRLSGASAELRVAGAALDLGGFAKGYALDRMRPLLLAHGIRSALLNFGQSSLWTLGQPADGPAWRLLVRGPGDSFAGMLELSNRALSVSGSLGQFVEIGGRRYGHVLDPRSGEPLTRRRQALVLAPEAALAEALSKALLVLGETEGLALVASLPGCEALLLDADGGAWRTPGFGPLLAPASQLPGRRGGEEGSRAPVRIPIAGGWPT